MQLKLPSRFAGWFVWTFHNKSHNMKELVILRHSWSPFLPLTFYREKVTFMGLCAPFWSIFSRKNSPRFPFSELFLSNIMKYGKNDIEWQTSVQSTSLRDCGIIGGKEKEALKLQVFRWWPADRALFVKWPPGYRYWHCQCSQHVNVHGPATVH